MSTLKKCWFVLFTSPNTALGLALGSVGLLTGGRWQLRRGCIEFHGGLVTWCLARLPLGTLSPVRLSSGAGAMTLGHVILGQSAASLDLSRDHEHVHVRQYERWGPLFLPAYLGTSVVLWWRGRDPYWDHPFEIAAYRQTDIHRPKN